MATERRSSWPRPSRRSCCPVARDVGLGGGARVGAGLHRVLLGGQPERVEAHRVQHVVPGHPQVAAQHVGADEAQRVPDVQPGAGRVGEHVQQVELLAARRGAGRIGPRPGRVRRVERALGGPAVLPGQLDVGWPARRRSGTAGASASAACSAPAAVLVSVLMSHSWGGVSAPERKDPHADGHEGSAAPDADQLVAASTRSRTGHGFRVTLLAAGSRSGCRRPTRLGGGRPAAVQRPSPLYPGRVPLTLRVIAGSALVLAGILRLLARGCAGRRLAAAAQPLDRHPHRGHAALRCGVRARPPGRRAVPAAAAGAVALVGGAAVLLAGDAAAPVWVVLVISVLGASGWPAWPRRRGPRGGRRGGPGGRTAGCLGACAGCDLVAGCRDRAATAGRTHRPAGHRRLKPPPHQPQEPGAPLNGPTTSSVTHPP